MILVTVRKGSTYGRNEAGQLVETVEFTSEEILTLGAHIGKLVADYTAKGLIVTFATKRKD